MKRVWIAVLVVACTKRADDPPWAMMPSGGTNGESTIAQAPLKVRRFAQAPLLDGKLDDAAWADAATTAPFVEPGKGGEARGSDVAAFAKLGWDDRKLYVGAVIFDSSPVSPFGRDDVDPHDWEKSSALELMVQPGDPGNNTNYYEIQVDVHGATFDTKWDDYNTPRTTGPSGKVFGHQEWSSNAERAIYVSDGRFYALEIAIPWTAFGTPPKAGDVWRLNLYSFKDGQRQALAWSPIRGQGNFHRSSRFGRIQFELSAPASAPAESAAARLLNEWFTAFNADDFKALHAWTVAHMPGKPDFGNEGFRTMTGGFEIKRIKDLSPTSVEAIVKEHKSDQFARAQLDLDPKDPNHIVEFHIFHGPTPAEFLTPEQRKARAIDGAKRGAVVDEIAKALDKTYVKADKAKSMAAAIRAHLAKGDYDKITDGEDFAQRLTDDLRADTRDLHMHVQFGPHPKDEPPPPPEAAQLEELRKTNFGFGRIERLAGNIAHIEIIFFPEAKLESVRNGIGDLMSRIADADALILDLRHNGGGDSDTVAFIASYMFDATPVHLNDIYEREANKTTPAWTLAKLPGKRFGGNKPVFVLTSAGTFSGGEDFAYSLQMTKRATVVGETTAGGAHPVKLVSLDDQFAIAMPYAESISPITHGNWEGTGVVPDVRTTADGALDEALKRAAVAAKH